MNAQKLTDVELNRAMIWLYPPEYRIHQYGDWPDFLNNWNLTMPLAVENKLWLQPGQATVGWFSYDDNDNHSFLNGNPLRSICEALVMIRLGGKQW